MTRTRASARQAGTRFERQVADYLAKSLDDDRIDRRVKTGAKDRGDIAGVRIAAGRVVIECKNTAKVSLGPWLREVEIERGNDDAVIGVVIHKRIGVAEAGEQYVTMRVADLVTLLLGVKVQALGDGAA